MRSVSARGMRCAAIGCSVPSSSIRTANAPPLLMTPSKPISRTAGWMSPADRPVHRYTVCPARRAERIAVTVEGAMTEPCSRIVPSTSMNTMRGVVSISLT